MGNCLFDSLNVFIGLASSHALRTALCEFVAKNAELFREAIEAETKQTVDAYVATMSRNGVDGDHIMICAAAMLYNTRIHTRMPNGQVFTEQPTEIDAQTKDCSIQWTPGHYSVAPQQQKRTTSRDNRNQASPFAANNVLAAQTTSQSLTSLNCSTLIGNLRSPTLNNGVLTNRARNIAIQSADKRQITNTALANARAIAIARANSVARARYTSHAQNGGGETREPVSSAVATVPSTSTTTTLKSIQASPPARVCHCRKCQLQRMHRRR